ncbi:unnamed protein product, partial [Ilex paraguariensis]
MASEGDEQEVVVIEGRERLDGVAARIDECQAPWGLSHVANQERRRVLFPKSFKKLLEWCPESMASEGDEQEVIVIEGRERLDGVAARIDECQAPWGLSHEANQLTYTDRDDADFGLLHAATGVKALGAERGGANALVTKEVADGCVVGRAGVAVQGQAGAALGEQESALSEQVVELNGGDHPGELAH